VVKQLYEIGLVTVLVAVKQVYVVETAG
jgi:hypothetical protein